MGIFCLLLALLLAFLLAYHSAFTSFFDFSSICISMFSPLVRWFLVVVGPVGGDLVCVCCFSGCAYSSVLLKGLSLFVLF